MISLILVIFALVCLLAAAFNLSPRVSPVQLLAAAAFLLALAWMVRVYNP